MHLYPNNNEPQLITVTSPFYDIEWHFEHSLWYSHRCITEFQAVTHNHLLSISASLAFSSSSFFFRLAASALRASTVSGLPSIRKASVAIFLLQTLEAYTRKCLSFVAFDDWFYLSEKRNDIINTLGREDTKFITKIEFLRLMPPFYSDDHANQSKGM